MERSSLHDGCSRKDVGLDSLPFETFLPLELLIVNVGSTLGLCPPQWVAANRWSMHVRPLSDTRYVHFLRIGKRAFGVRNGLSSR